MLSVLAARDNIADKGKERWEKGGIRRPRDKELKGLMMASTLTSTLLYWHRFNDVCDCLAKIILQLVFSI